MTKQKKQLIAQKSMEELKALAKELRGELFKHKIEHSKMQLKQTTQIRTKRDELARVLTSLQMKGAMKKIENKTTSKKEEQK